MNTKTMYESLGISAEVFEFGEDILAKLEERFKKIDAVAEYNQGKVISAKQKNMVKSVPNFTVCVDSPLAAEATKIYASDLRGYLDEEAMRAYIHRKRDEGHIITHMSLLIAAYYKAVLENPKLNYFVMI